MWGVVIGLVMALVSIVVNLSFVLRRKRKG